MEHSESMNRLEFLQPPLGTGRPKMGCVWLGFLETKVGGWLESEKVKKVVTFLGIFWGLKDDFGYLTSVSFDRLNSLNCLICTF